MRTYKSCVFHLFKKTIASVFLVSILTSAAHAEMKEWTFLTFLNGNNNLDTFGALNINQMEEVGSTKDINIVVQWASLANKKTQRLYVTKDNDTKKVTSPVLEDMGKVDMGDWRNIVEFVKWGVEHFPAKHYFLNIWDHGSGWRAIRLRNGVLPMGFHITDISWDDNTGNSITTLQLGQAIAESAKIIGHKLDLYASDACLMAMPEIANEMSDSVNVFAGSEEVEPGAGWPYQNFLKKWAALPKSSAASVAKFLSTEYVASYNGGVNGKDDATFSAFDLSHMETFNQAFEEFGKGLSKLSEASLKQVIQASAQTLRFSYDDYADLSDFIANIEKAKLHDSPKEATDGLKSAIDQFVVTHDATPKMSRSGGVSIWLPTSSAIYEGYVNKYKSLKFHANTRWGDTLKLLIQK